jgi:purine catabolism regulator
MRVPKWHEKLDICHFGNPRYIFLMTATVARLCGKPEFNLRLLAEGTGLHDPVSWIGSSDLSDPCEFLAAGQILLTTGRQFEGWATQDAFDDYVSRLRSAGIVGVGFGTEIFQAGTPDLLVSSCNRLSMALFEVPYRTPFIALAKWAANALHEEADARNRWANKAQRSVSLAAIKRRDLQAVLSTLARELNGDAYALDHSGNLIGGTPGISAADAEEVIAESRRLIAAGQRSGSSLRLGTHSYSIQTLGDSGQLSGVMVVRDAGARDAATNAVITTAVGLCEIALEEARRSAIAGSKTREALFSLLVSGHIDAARKFPEFISSFPAMPSKVTVCLLARSQSLEERSLEVKETLLNAAIHSFIAPHGEYLAVLTPAAQLRSAKKALLREHMRAGFSEAVPLDQVSKALMQAEISLLQSSPENLVVSWDSLSHPGTLSSMAVTSVRELALVRIRPLLDREDGDELVRVAKIWFSSNCSWSEAASKAQLHRHVLKSRLRELESLLDVSLKEFSGRAELWFLLSVADEGNSLGQSPNTKPLS